MKKLTAKARKLLLKVKAHILEEPLRLRMGEFIRTKVVDGSSYDVETLGFGQEGNSRDIKYPACNTVGCIAGWIDLLSNGMPRTAASSARRAERAERFATKALGYNSNQEENPASGLFYQTGWAPKFVHRYDRAKTPKTRAKIVAEVIDNFIEAH
jgi:hypothetical protein